MAMAHTHDLHVPKSSDIEPGNDYPTEQASVLPSPRSITERGPLGYWPKALSTPWLLFFLCFVLVLISALELAARILPANSRQNVLDLRSGGDGILERRLLATLFPNGTTDDHVTSGISAQTFATQEWHSTLNQSGKAGPRAFVPLTSTMTMSQTETKGWTAVYTLFAPLNTNTAQAPEEAAAVTAAFSTAPSVAMSRTSNGMKAAMTSVNPIDFSIVRVRTAATTYISGFATITSYQTTNIPLSEVDTASATVIATLGTGTRVTATDNALVSAFRDNAGPDHVSQPPILPIVENGSIATVVAVPTSISNRTADHRESEDAQHSIVLTYPIWKIFVGSYLLVLVAVLLQMLWTPIHSNAKLMQPFVSMARAQGALTNDVFLNDYLSSVSSPWRMVRQRAWLVLCGTLNSVFLAILAPLTSEAVYLDKNYECDNKDASQVDSCWPPRISADPGVIRVLQIILSIIAVVCLCMALVAKSSPCPVYVDPSSIAGVASFVHHPDLVQDLQDLEPEASVSGLQQRLPNRRYTLQHYEDMNKRLGYGFIPFPTAHDGFDKQDEARALRSNSQLRVFLAKYSNAALIASTLAILTGLLGLLVAYSQDGSNSGFNNFFNSNAFGPRFIMTGLASLAAICFIVLYEEVTLTAPFHRLHHKPSTASSSIWLPKSSLPIVSMAIFIKNGYIFPALFSTTAASTNVLVILAASVPFSAGRIRYEYILSTWICVGILSVMICAVLGLCFWKRKLTMPRKPDTLAGLMSYLWHAQGWELSRGAVDEKYTYGLKRGADGRSRWTIDVWGEQNMSDGA